MQQLQGLRAVLYMVSIAALSAYGVWWQTSYGMAYRISTNSMTYDRVYQYLCLEVHAYRDPAYGISSNRISYGYKAFLVYSTSYQYSNRYTDPSRYLSILQPSALMKTPSCKRRGKLYQYSQQVELLVVYQDMLYPSDTYPQWLPIEVASIILQQYARAFGNHP